MSLRFLITGGSGFVGANLARRALRDGHEAHLLLRPEHQSWRIDEVRDEIRCHKADISDAEATRRVVRDVRPDQVFHLAAYGAYSTQQDTARMIAANVLGCANLLDACTETGVDAFINAGSSSEYGFKDHPPDEEEALTPNSRYAITKAAATQYCRLAATSRGLNAVTVRLYSVYGPWEDPNRLIPTLIVKGLKGQLPPLVSPETARDFVCVDDAVDAMLRIAAHPSPGAIYNVCSGVQTTVESAVDVARSLMPIDEQPQWRAMESRVWDTSVWVGTGARLEKDLGWKVSTPFREGLRRTIDWFIQNPRLWAFYESSQRESFR